MNRRSFIKLAGLGVVSVAVSALPINLQKQVEDDNIAVGFTHDNCDNVWAIQVYVTEHALKLSNDVMAQRIAQMLTDSFKKIKAVKG